MIYISIVVQLCTLVCSVTAPGPRDRSVNLNLETVMTFDRKNLVADVKIIDNVQKFLNKVRNVLDQSQKGPGIAKRSFSDSPLDGDIKFTGFLEHVIRHILTYDDDDLENIAAIIDDEIRKYHYKGCKFYELVEDNDKLRYYVTNLLEQMKQLEGKKLRNLLMFYAKKLKDSDFSTKELDILEYLNSLYTDEAQDHMRRILNDLDDFKKPSRRTHPNLVKTIRKGLRSIIFDRYSKLNEDTRRDIKMKIASYVVEYVPEGYIGKGKIITYGTVTLVDYETTKKTKEKFLRNLEDKAVINTGNRLSYPARNLKAEKERMPQRFISLYPEEIPTSTKKHKTKEILRNHKHKERIPKMTGQKLEHKKLTTMIISKEVDGSLEIEDKPETKPKKVKSSSEEATKPKLESSVEYKNNVRIDSKEAEKSLAHKEDSKEKSTESSSEKIKSSHEIKSKIKSMELESSIEDEIKSTTKSAVNKSSLDFKTQHESKIDKVEGSSEHETISKIRPKEAESSLEHEARLQNKSRKPKNSLKHEQKHKLKYKKRGSSRDHDAKHKIKSEEVESSLEHETKQKVKSKMQKNSWKHEINQKIKSKKVQSSLEQEINQKLKPKKVESSLEQKSNQKLKPKKVKSSLEHKKRPQKKSKDKGILEQEKPPYAGSKQWIAPVQARPKTVMVVRQGRPLRELITEHNSIIQDMSSQSPQSFQNNASVDKTWKKRSRSKKQRHKLVAEKPGDLVKNQNDKQTLRSRNREESAEKYGPKHLRSHKSYPSSFVNRKDKRSRARALRRQIALQNRKNRHNLQSQIKVKPHNTMLNKIDKLDEKLEVVISKLNERTVTYTKNYNNENPLWDQPAEKWKQSRRTTNTSSKSHPSKYDIEIIRESLKHMLPPSKPGRSDIQKGDSNENKIFFPISDTIIPTMDSEVGSEGLVSKDGINHSRKEESSLKNIGNYLTNNKSSTVGQRFQVGSFTTKISNVQNVRIQKTFNNELIAGNTSGPGKKATESNISTSDKNAFTMKDDHGGNSNNDKKLSPINKFIKPISSKYDASINENNYISPFKDSLGNDHSTNDTIKQIISIEKERHFRASDNEDNESENKTINNTQTNDTIDKRTTEKITTSTIKSSGDGNKEKKTKTRIYDDQILTTDKVSIASSDNVIKPTMRNKYFRASEDDQHEEEEISNVKSTFQNDKFTSKVENVSTSESHPTATTVLKTPNINNTLTDIFNFSSNRNATGNNTKLNTTKDVKDDPSNKQITVTVENTSNSTSDLISTTASINPVSLLTSSLGTTVTEDSTHPYKMLKQAS